MLTNVTSRAYPLWLIRVLRIAAFTVLILIASRIRIPVPGTPVPITLQTLAVLLAGMSLGPIEGAISVLSYLGLVALGVDGRLPTELHGIAVFLGPTAGYLIGFVPGAAIAGLAWRAADRWKFALSLLCGFVAAVVIFFFGVWGLSLYSGSWQAALVGGAVPFVIVDFGKVLLAASLVKLGHESRLRWFAN
ncbi:MAG: biotin transporter BioY [Anaerolineae bacterium]|nr:biotin transporter BioY [Anaerolineae bacterium]